MWPGKANRAVVCVGRQGVAVALTKPKAAEVKAEVFAAPSLLTADKLDDLQAGLEQVQAWLHERAGEAFVEVSLLLADPLISHQVLSLESLPKSRRAQQELVQWRVAETLNVDKTELSVIWQASRDEVRDAVSVHAMALPRAMHETLIKGFHDAGWPVVMLGSLSQAVAAGRETGAGTEHTDKSLALFIGDDFWLASHHEAGLMSQIRCRWFEAEDQALNREVARALNVEGASAVQLVSLMAEDAKVAEIRAQVSGLLGDEALRYAPVLDGCDASVPALQQLACWLARAA